MNTVTIWRTALERLEHTTIDAASKTWLQEAHLVNIPRTDDSDDIDTPLVGQPHEVYFSLQVPNNLAYDVINTRWRRPLEEILTDLTGQSVSLSVTHNPDEDTPDTLINNDRTPSERVSFPPKTRILTPIYNLSPVDQLIQLFHNPTHAIWTTALPTPSKTGIMSNAPTS